MSKLLQHIRDIRPDSSELRIVSDSDIETSGWLYLLQRLYRQRTGADIG